MRIIHYSDDNVGLEFYKLVKKWLLVMPSTNCCKLAHKKELKIPWTRIKKETKSVMNGMSYIYVITAGYIYHRLLWKIDFIRFARGQDCALQCALSNPRSWKFSMYLRDRNMFYCWMLVGTKSMNWFSGFKKL